MTKIIKNFVKTIALAGILSTSLNCQYIRDIPDMREPSRINKTRDNTFDRWGRFNLVDIENDLYLQERLFRDTLRITSTPEEEEVNAVFVKCGENIIYSTPSKKAYITDLNCKETKEISYEDFKQMFEREMDARLNGRCTD